MKIRRVDSLLRSALWNLFTRQGVTLSTFSFFGIKFTYLHPVFRVIYFQFQKSLTIIAFYTRDSLVHGNYNFLLFRHSSKRTTIMRMRDLFRPKFFPLLKAAIVQSKSAKIPPLSELELDIVMKLFVIPSQSS